MQTSICLCLTANAFQTQHLYIWIHLKCKVKAKLQWRLRRSKRQYFIGNRIIIQIFDWFLSNYITLFAFFLALILFFIKSSKFCESRQSVSVYNNKSKNIFPIFKQTNQLESRSPTSCAVHSSVFHPQVVFLHQLGKCATVMLMMSSTPHPTHPPPSQQLTNHNKFINHLTDVSPACVHMAWVPHINQQNVSPAHRASI